MQILNESYKYGILKRAHSNVMRREEMAKEFISRICSSKYVRMVFLVGSRARGDHVPSSDFDIVVVTASDSDPVKVAEDLFSMKREPVPIDLIVLSENDLDDPIYREMLKDKKRLC